MEKSDIESLRKFYELAYQEDDSSAVVVVEYGEVDYTNNKTIKEFKENGYEKIDSNRFGEGFKQIGEFLVFAKKR
jgi:predicted DNA-binding WGR domain protein